MATIGRRSSKTRTAKRPRPEPPVPSATGRTALLVGLALVAGTLTGVAAIVATSSPSTTEVAVVTPAPAVVAPTPAPPAPAFDEALARTLRSSSQLADAGKERFALEAL